MKISIYYISINLQLIMQQIKWYVISHQEQSKIINSHGMDLYDFPFIVELINQGKNWYSISQLTEVTEIPWTIIFKKLT